MSRDWLVLHTAMITKPKYRRLSPIGRGALLHVLALGGFQAPEATWVPDELREALILEGFPQAVLDELVGLGWLDLEEDALVIHDWDKHQWAASTEVQRSWEAARKREWRRQRNPPSPTPPVKRDSEDRIGKSPEMSGTVPDMSGATTAPVNGTTNLHEFYHHLAGHAASMKERNWIDDMDKAHGRSVVAAAMRADPDPRERGFLDRVRGRLIKGGDMSGTPRPTVDPGLSQRLVDEQWAKDHPGWAA